MKLAVIPARGGSKRIRRKNIRDFCGRPIIAYSIEAAIISELFDRVIVSTDDEEIAGIARNLGAEVPFMRPIELADDFTGTNAVVSHAIKWFDENDQSVSIACCIYPTAPFLDVEYLLEGYNRLNGSDMLFAFSVTSFAFPIQRAIRILKHGGVQPIWPKHIGSRSQDLEVAYHDAGQFYWGFPDAFINNRDLFSDRAIPIVLPRHLVQDIDNHEDWRRAELMYKAL